LDILFNNFPKELIYNFCAVAYSTLGYIHTSETKTLMSKLQSGDNNGFFGITHTAETKSAIGAALSGRTFSAETKAAISEAISGNTNAPSMVIFVYEHDTLKLVGEYLSQRKAAKSLKVSQGTVRNYLASGKVLNNKYIIRTSPFP